MIKNVILSTLAIAVLAGCSGKKDSDKDTSVVEAIPVKVQKLEKENIARTLDYTANLQADEQVYYAPAATGRIEKIYVEVGDRIKKGQLLVEMDRTNLQQAEVQLKNLETEFKTKLFIRTPRGMPSTIFSRTRRKDSTRNKMPSTRMMHRAAL